jgi:hypothetical protein
MATTLEIDVDGISDVIATDFEDKLWDLKAEIFEAMKRLGAVPEDAEGSDCEEEIKQVLVAAWGKM